MGIGMKDSGKEGEAPQKDTVMFGGIYDKMRHPQAVGEVNLFLALGILFNSPFLAIFSLVWYPVYYLFCKIEERDLLLRFGEQYAEYKKRVGMFPIRRSTKESTVE